MKFHWHLGILKETTILSFISLERLYLQSARLTSYNFLVQHKQIFTNLIWKEQLIVITKIVQHTMFHLE